MQSLTQMGQLLVLAGVSLIEKKTQIRVGKLHVMDERASERKDITIAIYDMMQ